MTANLIVGQSGGPTTVINCSLAGVIEAAQRSGSIDGIIGMRRGVEGLLEDDVVPLQVLEPDKLCRLRNTPGSALGACRRKISDEEAVGLVATLREMDVSYLCYIGGNDSADTTHKLAVAARDSGHTLFAMAVPKTIDNDLPETDHCPGFGSIARYVATAAIETCLDTRSLPSNYPVKIVEVMGRDAGWVAASSGLGRTSFETGPHLIYVPELPFDRDTFLESVTQIHNQIGYVVVVAAETIRDSHGNPVAADVASVDDFGHPIVRGAGEALVRMVEAELGLPARCDRPGTLQRSSGALGSSVDESEAYDVGTEAVRLCLDGMTDRMVTIERLPDQPYEIRLGTAGLEHIVDRRKLLPRRYLNSAGTFITDDFRTYAMPLLGPDPFPKYVSLPL